MDIANYILSCLSSQKMIVFSWGFNSPVAISDGLRFSVNGFIHQGIVEVNYNYGTDLFDIRLLKDEAVLNKLHNIYVDDLVDTLDSLIEKVDNYKERVTAEYHSLL